MAYRFDGRQKLLAIGVYPQISVPAAREKARIAREHLAAGRDPGLIRKISKGINDSDGTFKAVALEWLEKFKCSSYDLI